MRTDVSQSQTNSPQFASWAATKIQLLQQFPHQFQYSPLVRLALHDNVEDFALSIDGTPQPAIDFDAEMTFTAATESSQNRIIVQMVAQPPWVVR
jgi:hypothetical protein